MPTISGVLMKPNQVRSPLRTFPDLLRSEDLLLCGKDFVASHIDPTEAANIYGVAPLSFYDVVDVLSSPSFHPKGRKASWFSGMYSYLGNQEEEILNFGLGYQFFKSVKVCSMRFVFRFTT